MLQAEFARTEVFDRPVAGRVFFEKVMRENLGVERLSHDCTIEAETLAAWLNCEDGACSRSQASLAGLPEKER